MKAAAKMDLDLADQVYDAEGYLESAYVLNGAWYLKRYGDCYASFRDLHSKEPVTILDHLPLGDFKREA